eukprot:364999-Chlamydomonas_euryale.AAC.29
MLIDRVVGRRLDPETGDIYHLTFKPPPEEIANRLTQRSDDTEEKVWDTDTAPCTFGDGVWAGEWAAFSTFGAGVWAGERAAFSTFGDGVWAGEWAAFSTFGDGVWAGERAAFSSTRAFQGESLAKLSMQI